MREHRVLVQGRMETAGDGGSSCFHHDPAVEVRDHQRHHVDDRVRPCVGKTAETQGATGATSYIQDTSRSDCSRPSGSHTGHTLLPSILHPVPQVAIASLAPVGLGLEGVRDAAKVTGRES